MSRSPTVVGAMVLLTSGIVDEGLSSCGDLPPQYYLSGSFGGPVGVERGGGCSSGGGLFGTLLGPEGSHGTSVMVCGWFFSGPYIFSFGGLLFGVGLGWGWGLRVVV
ncbi:hypothetical protein GCM10027026_31100 [Myroides odoratimimus subsp. xuanwuensis]